MITQTSVFKQNDEIALPFGTDGAKDRKVCAFINEYEPIFLIKAMGIEVANLFDAGWNASEQRWLDILDGCTYTVGTTQYYFAGVRPLLNRFIYCEYLDHENSSTTLVGEQKVEAQNAAALFNNKVIRQWNIMSSGMNDLWNILVDRVDGSGVRVYPEFPYPCDVQYFRSRNQFSI